MLNCLASHLRPYSAQQIYSGTKKTTDNCIPRNIIRWLKISRRYWANIFVSCSILLFHSFTALQIPRRIMAIAQPTDERDFRFIIIIIIALHIYALQTNNKPKFEHHTHFSTAGNLFQFRRLHLEGRSKYNFWFISSI